MANSNNIPLSLKMLRLMYSRLGQIFPEYIGNHAYEKWFTVPPTPTPKRELACLEAATTEVVDVYGLPVMTYRWGEGPAILFIHGWAGRGTQVFPYIEPLTQAGYQVVSIDGPAHGRTPGKRTSFLQTVDVALAMQEIYGTFSGVITHSFGGVVLNVSLNFGFSTKKAVCICPPENFEMMFSNFVDTVSLPKAAEEVMRKKLHSSYGHIIQDMVSSVKNTELIDFPMLLIHDRDDPEIPWQASQHIADALPNAEAHFTNGLKHRRIVRDPEVVRTAIDFLLRDSL